MTEIGIVGGGILGFSTAHRLTERFPGVGVHLFEKESGLAEHQTGRNSGVLHAGVYYEPGSSKAKLCRDGLQRMKQFCLEHSIEHDICGKLIVAKDQSEVAKLEDLYRRATANGCTCRFVSAEEVSEREPHLRAHKALLVEDTGIVDYRCVTEKLAELAAAKGTQINFASRVTDIRRDGAKWLLITTSGERKVDLLINCAGLQCDRICKISGLASPVQIIPFRGEYYKLTEQAKGLVKHLIYPVPDPKLPFLGVHFNRTIDGRVECGPNAVMAFAREGYSFWQINAGDLMEILSYPGFWRFSQRFWRPGLQETLRSRSKNRYLKSLQELIPELSADDIVPSGTGIRAQAVNRKGEMVMDFLFVSRDGIVNVLNAPSPGATASLSIGDHIVDQVQNLI